MSHKFFTKIFPYETSSYYAKEKRTVELAEIMEITLDNGLPDVLCCYQEDYHRRLDRPEGTWKRVIVPFYLLYQSQEEPDGERSEQAEQRS